MRKLRVLFVTHCSAMGGGNFSMLQLMKELKENYNVEPIVLAHRDKSILNIQDKCKLEGITCITSPFYWFKEKRGVKQYLHYLINVTFYYPIIFFKLRKLNVDLVHSNGSVIDIGAFLSRVKGVKHIWHIREYGDLDFDLHPIFGKRWERFVYAKGDCFIAISESIKNAFWDVIPKEKIKVIYNGICVSKYACDATHLNAEIQFVMVGTIQAPKNQLEALQAFSLLKEKGYRAHLHFLGFEDKVYLKILKEYIESHSLMDYVSFWGVCDDIPSILSKMDVGLMLSKSEAFGRVTVEYMLQNLAVIVSNTGANTEIVEDGYSGYVYTLGNVEELFEKMRLCIVDRDNMLKIARNGKNVALQKFTSTRNTKEIFDVYKQISFT